MFFNEKIAQFHILASSAEEVIEIAANEIGRASCRERV